LSNIWDSSIKTLEFRITTNIKACHIHSEITS